MPLGVDTGLHDAAFGFAGALLNAVHTVGSLVFVIPPLLYGIKTLACGYCAFYAYQIRDRISGAEQIP